MLDSEFLWYFVINLLFPEWICYLWTMKCVLVLCMRTVLIWFTHFYIGCIKQIHNLRRLSRNANLHSLWSGVRTDIFVCAIILFRKYLVILVEEAELPVRFVLRHLWAVKVLFTFLQGQKICRLIRPICMEYYINQQPCNLIGSEAGPYVRINVPI